MMKRWITAVCVALWAAITLTSCGSRPQPIVETVGIEPQMEAGWATTEPDQPVVAALDWQDACVLTTEEMTALVQPVVETGWSEYWTRVEYTEEGYPNSEGGVRCFYEGDKDFAVAEITIYPIAANEAYEQRCADWVGIGPLEDTDLVALCDSTIAEGAVVSNDRAWAHVYLDDTYAAAIVLLTVGTGAEIEPVMMDIAQAIGERWQQ